MADVGQELVLGPVRRLGGLLGEAELLLGPLLAGHVQVQALDEAEGAVRGEHPMAARPDPPDRAVLVSDAVLVLVHPPLPQGGEDGLAGRRPVLGQHDVAVVEPVGSELVGRVAGQFFDALAGEQGGPVIVGQGPVGQSRKVPKQRVELPLALPQRLLGLPEVVDVSDRRHQPQRPTLCVSFDDFPDGLDPDPVPVVPAHLVLGLVERRPAGEAVGPGRVAGRAGRRD